MNKKTQILLASGIVAIPAVMLIVPRLLPTEKVEADSYEIGRVQKAQPLAETGQVQAAQQEQLTIPDGQLKILLENNATVTANQVVATVTNQENADAVLDAKLALETANATVSRKQTAVDALKKQPIEDVRDQLTSAQEDLAMAQSEQKSAQSKVAAAQNKVTQNIVSPIDGQLIINDGPDAKQKTLTVYGGNREVVGNVTDFDFDKIQPGDHVSLVTHAGDAKDDAATVVTRDTIGKSQQGRPTTYEFKISTTDAFKIGQKVKISVPQQGVRVPKSAVKTSGDQQYVYRVVDGKARRVNIASHVAGGGVVVTDGLAAGDKVVYNPGKENLDGRKVTG
jgi:HlyD family secretion protein